MLKEVSIIQADVKNYTTHLLGKNDISLFTSMSKVIGIDYYLLSLRFLVEWTFDSIYSGMEEKEVLKYFWNLLHAEIKFLFKCYSNFYRVDFVHNQVYSALFFIHGMIEAAANIWCLIIICDPKVIYFKGLSLYSRHIFCASNISKHRQ